VWSPVGIGMGLKFGRRWKCLHAGCQGRVEAVGRTQVASRGIADIVRELAMMRMVVSWR
jgi:hypothetical protein